MKIQQYSPLTVTQTLVVHALLLPYRSLAIVPPQRGMVRLSADVLPVKYQTYKRLQELGALVLDAGETQAGQREVYRLSQQGHQLWADHCRVDARYDPGIDA